MLTTHRAFSNMVTRSTSHIRTISNRHVNAGFVYSFSVTVICVTATGDKIKIDVFLRETFYQHLNQFFDLTL